MKKEEFNFKWKLTENYFNGIIVLFFTVLVSYAIYYNDIFYMFLAGLWGLICPFIATFIDKKSHETKKK